MRDVPTSSEMSTADCVILVQKGNKSRNRLVKIWHYDNVTKIGLSLQFSFKGNYCVFVLKKVCPMIVRVVKN